MKNLFHLLNCTCFVFVCADVSSSKVDVIIGALFQGEANVERRAVDFVVSNLNSRNKRFNFHILDRNLSSDEPLDTLVEGCNLADLGATFFIGTARGKAAHFLNSFSNQFNIPLLVIDNLPYFGGNSGQFSYSTKPSKALLYGVLRHLLKRKNIRNLIAVYELENESNDPNDFFGQADDVKFVKNFASYKIKIETAEGDSTTEKAFHRASIDIKNMIYKDNRIKFEGIVLFTSALAARFIMRNIYSSQSESRTPIYWFIVNNDVNSLNEIALTSFTSWTIFIIKQYIDDYDETMANFAQSWKRNLYRDCNSCAAKIFSPSDIPLEVYQIHDGLHHLAVTLEKLATERVFISATRMHCTSGAVWPGGQQIMQQMHSINSTGLLSKINLNRFGQNQCGSFEIRTKETGIKENFGQAKIWSFGQKNNNLFALNDIEKAFFRVVTVTETPFVMQSGNGSNFSGFSIELFDKLSKIYKFDYTIYAAPDGNYGSKLENGSWNGIIWELVSGQADIAVAAMTITADREEVVDFPKRYLDYSVGIAIRRPHSSTSLFSFVEPFHSSVWFCVVLSLVFVVVLVYYLHQISPSNYKSSKQEKEFDEELQFSTVFWCIYSSFMQQGSEIKTRSFAVRLAFGFWWLFSLIVVSSYTANLAAFLTVQRMDLPIRSLNDLVKQKEIGYGTLSQTSFYDNILAKGREASDEKSKFKKMSRVITAPENQLKSWKDGFRRATQGNFAFLWDVAVIEYEVIMHENCSLTMISDTAIFDKGYGFALQQGSPYRDVFSTGILNLQESGEIKKLKEKYWPKSGKCSLNEEGATTSARERTLENFTGVFFVLAAGLFLSFLFAVCEIIVFYFKDRQQRSNRIQYKKTKNSSEKHVVELMESNSSSIREDQLLFKESEDMSKPHSKRQKIPLSSKIKFMRNYSSSIKLKKKSNRGFIQKPQMNLKRQSERKETQEQTRQENSANEHLRDQGNLVVCNKNATVRAKKNELNSSILTPYAIASMLKKSSV